MSHFFAVFRVVNFSFGVLLEPWVGLLMLLSVTPGVFSSLNYSPEGSRASFCKKGVFVPKLRQKILEYVVIMVIISQKSASVGTD